MDDLDELLRPGIARAAEDAAEPPDFDAILSRGARLRHRRTLTAAVLLALAVVTVLGSLQLVGIRQTLPASPSPQRSSTPQRSIPTGDAVIQPGTYRIPVTPWSAVEYAVTFPTGWTVQEGYIFHRHGDEPAEVTFSAAVVSGIYADACLGDTGAVTPVGPGAADLVRALLAQPGAAVTGPVDTRLGGHPATRVDLAIPSSLDLRACSLEGKGLQIWSQAAVDDYLVLLPGGRASVYVLDVDGTRQVFTTQYRAGATAADRAELQTVLDSILFP
jgi:hypothetical protein